jgi:hypothetical protein
MQAKQRIAQRAMPQATCQHREGAAPQRVQKAVLPALSLLQGVPHGGRGAAYMRVFYQKRCMPSAGHLDPKRQVLDDRAGRQIGPRKKRPGERHAGSREQRRPTQPLHSARSEQIFDDHREAGNLHHGRRFQIGRYQIDCLHRHIASQRVAAQRSNAAGRQAAVRIEDDHHCRGIARGQVIAPEGERVALAAAGGIVPLGDFGAPLAGKSGCLVTAVVGDHQDACTRRSDVGERREGSPDPAFFVMRRDEHGGSATGYRSVSAAGRQETGDELHRQHCQRQRDDKGQKPRERRQQATHVGMAGG